MIIALERDEFFPSNKYEQVLRFNILLRKRFKALLLQVPEYLLSTTYVHPSLLWLSHDFKKFLSWRLGLFSQNKWCSFSNFLQYFEVVWVRSAASSFVLTGANDLWIGCICLTVSRGEKAQYACQKVKTSAGLD